MILALLAPVLMQAVPPAAVTLGAIGQQALPEKGCAAYLWSVSDRRLVAMAVAEPAQIRLEVDGKVSDYTRTGQSGVGGYGFAGTTEYRGGTVTATLDMTVATREDLSQGAVAQAVLRVEQPGRDALAVPVAGLIGCR